MHAAIIEGEEDLLAGSGPALLGLPDVAVLASQRVVAEAAPDRRHRLLDVIDGRGGAAGNTLGARLALGQDVESIVAPEAELHRYPRLDLDLVEGRRVVNRLEEAAESVADSVANASRARIEG